MGKSIGSQNGDEEDKISDQIEDPTQAGIERDVILHSAVKEKGMEVTPTKVRQLSERTDGPGEERIRLRLLGVEDDDMEDDSDGDESTIALFDEYAIS